ncbi:MAG: ABC transporter ATP-binding protein [Candidatus Odinarchaeota archaeon]
MATVRRGPGALAQQREKHSRPLLVLLKEVFIYLGQFRRTIFIGAILAIIGTLFVAVDPIVLAQGVDLLLTPEGTATGLLVLGGLYLFLRIAGWVLSSIYTWVLAGAQAGFVQKLQQDVYDHLIRADLSYHRSEQSGNVTSRITSDTDSLSAGIQIIIEFATQLLLLVATFLIMWVESPFVALTSLVVVPVVIFIVVLFGTVGQRIMLSTQRAVGKVSGQIMENLAGIHVAKAFNREEETSSTLRELNQELYHNGIRFTMLMILMGPLVQGTSIAGISAVLFVSGSIATGAFPLSTVTITLGEVILGTILIQRFVRPLITLSTMATQFQASMASMDRLLDVLESEPEIVDSENAVPLKAESDGIAFEGVSFSYDGDTEVLHDVTFTINPGETVAIVGHTGAGKTTMASLINRFYDPTKGCIKIGDQFLREITLESLHDNVALIAQEPYLFHGTVLENIQYTSPESTEADVIDLCKLIGAHDFIEVLTDGYRTVITESGKNLSAGQVQMIAIARTMLADPKILILDEATSRLDAYSESLVQAAQEKLFANRTTVVIAHRLTTIANASRIFVFDQGKLAETGTHEELLALRGIYKDVYDTYYAHQSVEELVVDVNRG